MTRVLVTGAFGLVGRSVLTRLLDDGFTVVATDLDTPANQKLAAAARPGLQVRWADLTRRDAVDRLLADSTPDAVVHLAAVIPPLCYADPSLARRVNVEATRNLVEAAAGLAEPPRFVQASSVAVYGARNPHTASDVLTAQTALAPSDLYGAHKAAAEQLVRGSTLDWVVLRLGGVLTTEQDRGLSLDVVHFEGLLPTDGRIQTVDVRDVARAFAAAVTAPVVGETLLIGGDASHRLTQGAITPALTAALGLEGGLPVGRPGDPADDAGWFATDWMDTTWSQQALGFQHHSWPAMVAEVRASAGSRRHLLRLLAPLLHEFLVRRSAYRHSPGRYADPWAAIAAKWGDPSPD
jgi:nucleoside-diphosphate-sugar epimerase